MFLPNQIPTKEQELILHYLLKTPPEDYIKECDTVDRQIHLMECKIFHLALHDFFKCHFIGKELKINFIDKTNNIQLKEILQKKTECQDFVQQLGLWLDYYLAFYAVVSWGWENLKKTLVELQQQTEGLYIPDNPGEALIEVIDIFFQGIFLTYFPEVVTGNFYREYSPRKAYDFRRKRTQVSILENRLKPLNKREKRLVENHKKQEAKNQKQLEPFLAKMKIYISICEKNQSGDETMKRRLENLNKAAMEFDSKILQSLHPRKKRKGYAINHGVRLEGRKEGGIYRA